MLLQKSPSSQVAVPRAILKVLNRFRERSTHGCPMKEHTHGTHHLLYCSNHNGLCSNPSPVRSLRPHPAVHAPEAHNPYGGPQVPGLLQHGEKRLRSSALESEAKKRSSRFFARISARVHSAAWRCGQYSHLACAHAVPEQVGPSAGGWTRTPPEDLHDRGASNRECCKDSTVLYCNQATESAEQYCTVLYRTIQ